MFEIMQIRETHREEGVALETIIVSASFVHLSTMFATPIGHETVIDALRGCQNKHVDASDRAKLYARHASVSCTMRKAPYSAAHDPSLAH